MIIRIAALTDVGKERDQNEDAFVICPDLAHPDWDRTKSEVELGKLGSLLAVADGMGGANAGEVASAIAMEAIKKHFSSPDIVSIVANETSIKAFLKASINAADQAIKDHITNHPETMGMGTTIVICWLIDDKAYIIWSGDSRCYVFNPQYGLQPLTKDHSYVQELIDLGELTKEEALSHPDNNIITRGLGDFDIDDLADITTYSIKPNDVFLLCSDGLCGYCTDNSIEKVFKANHGNVKKCCTKLMNLALETGGYDNICLAIASFSDI